MRLRLRPRSPPADLTTFLLPRCSRYLERAVAFAKRANAGVQDVDLPVLVLVSNKRTADEVDLDIQRTSEAFSRRCVRARVRA